MKNFPSRLRELMEKQHLTQQALAEKAHTSQTSVMRWLAGAARPHPRAMAELAVALGVRPAWLEDGTEPRELGVAIKRGRRIDPEPLVVRDEGMNGFHSKLGNASIALALLETEELWELVQGLPHMIATAPNDTVRQRLACEAEAAAEELRTRSKS